MSSPERRLKAGNVLEPNFLPSGLRVLNLFTATAVCAVQYHPGFLHPLLSSFPFTSPSLDHLPRLGYGPFALTVVALFNCAFITFAPSLSTSFIPTTPLLDSYFDLHLPSTSFILSKSQPCFTPSSTTMRFFVAILAPWALVALPSVSFVNAAPNLAERQSTSSTSATTVSPLTPSLTNEGSPLLIQWDTTTNQAWSSMEIKFMTGSNQNMTELYTVATGVDGTSAGAGKLLWTAPNVKPNSNIYFFQFTHSGQDPTWTTRFAIADASGAVTAPPYAKQPEGPAIPWGNGRIVSGAVASSSSSSASASDSTPSASSSTSVAALSATASASSSSTASTSPSSSSSSSTAQSSNNSLSSSSSSQTSSALTTARVGSAAAIGCVVAALAGAMLV